MPPERLQTTTDYLIREEIEYQRGFYHGLTWIIPTAVASLLLGYGFARMRATLPDQSELRSTPSALEVSSNSSEK